MSPAAPGCDGQVDRRPSAAAGNKTTSNVIPDIGRRLIQN
jgi:hypothetical protein